MKDYVEVDDAIITNQLLTDSEIIRSASSISDDKIIESVWEESANDIAHQSDDDMVTIHRARGSLLQVRKFFEHSKHTVAIGSLDLVMEIENNMDKISTSHLTQSKITDFLVYINTNSYII